MNFTSFLFTCPPLISLEWISYIDFFSFNMLNGFCLCFLFSFNLSFPFCNVETREHKEMTSKSDIYGFGILLLHLITGKNSSGDEDIESGVNGSFVNWARYSYSNCHIDTWIDSSIDMSVHKREIVHVMNLALNCTAIDPQERPCTKNVLQALESTSSSSSSCTTYFSKIPSLA